MYGSWKFEPGPGLYSEQVTIQPGSEAHKQGMLLLLLRS